MKISSSNFLTIYVVNDVDSSRFAWIWPILKRYLLGWTIHHWYAYFICLFVFCEIIPGTLNTNDKKMNGADALF